MWCGVAATGPQEAWHCCTTQACTGNATTTANGIHSRHRRMQRTGSLRHVRDSHAKCRSLSVGRETDSLLAKAHPNILSRHTFFPANSRKDTHTHTYIHSITHTIVTIRGRACPRRRAREMLGLVAAHGEGTWTDASHASPHREKRPLTIVHSTVSATGMCLINCKVAGCTAVPCICAWHVRTYVHCVLAGFVHVLAAG
jgi:hypothetical protein